MNVTSISDKLKAVVLSGVLSVSAVGSGAAQAADQVSGNNGKQTTVTAQQIQPAANIGNSAEFGTVPGSIENLFQPMSYRENLVKKSVWKGAKEFAELVKQNAAQKRFANTALYEGVPPITQFMPGYPKGPTPGGALNIRQFAEYVQFRNLNGDPRIDELRKRAQEALKNPAKLSEQDRIQAERYAKLENHIHPVVIVGVVTPDNNFDPSWRKKMSDAKGIAVEVMQKYGASQGAAVTEIVRVIAKSDETIFSERNGAHYKIEDGIIVTVGDRVMEWYNRQKNPDQYHDGAFPEQLGSYNTALEGMFERNFHTMNNSEYLDYFCKGSDNPACVQREAEKVANKAAGGKSTGGSGSTGKSGSGKAGTGSIASTQAPAL